MARNSFLHCIVVACILLATVQVRPQTQKKQKFLKGFGEKVSGEVISYWNFHPLARQALLSRCTTGEMAIEWKTQSLPATSVTDTVSFLWIGAFSTGTSTADHEFDFSVNGEKCLTFRTFKGGNYNNWSVRGAKGLVLSYRHVWTDHVNDAHGYFQLQVPPSVFRAGERLALKVVGHKAQSRDWYMTFEYAVKESATVRSLPLLVREHELLRQPIEISVDSPAEQGTVDIGVDGAKEVQYPLKLGWNPVVLHVPVVEHERAVPLTISINAGEVEKRTVQVRPVHHRTIWLLPHSHNDIGYSDLQTTVLNIQIQNIRDALRLIEKTKDHPVGSRFKWNVEILWPVDSFLVKASAQEREDFVRAVRNGDIGLNALYVNPLTGIARPEALIRLTDFARELSRNYGLQLPAAMVSDIPGFSWGIVPALAQGGVRYFVSGPNSGDRIGHFTRVWGDKPFYWVGPSRKDSVLFWVAGTGYSLFHGTRTLATNAGFLQKLQEYLDQLDDTNYPYDIVQMRYTVYSDNGMTDSTLSDFVRDWNTTHASPTLRIGTAEEMCVAFERQYGSLLPSFAGDMTPYWEDGAASTAAELGMAERATERLVQSEIVARMLAPKGFNAKAFADAWADVNLWIEHTWGAWNSVSDPDNASVVAQWKIKSEFARESENRSKAILQQTTHVRDAASSDMFEVINTSTWPRTDVVTLTAEESRLGNKIVDAHGRSVLSQRLVDGRLAFLARDVPPLSSSRFALTRGQPPNPAGVTVKPWTLRNQFISIVIDSTTGAIRSIYDLTTKQEYVANQSNELVNSIVVVEGIDPAHRSEGQNIKCRIGEKGPLVASLISECTASGINNVVREFYLMNGMNRLDIRNVVDKKPVRDKEAVYFGFAFNIPDPVTRLDLGWGYVRPEAEQLPGSCKDFFSVQRWVDVSNNEKGITWATVEAPLVSLGGLVDERQHNQGPDGWKTHATSSSLLYSWVMNNYWHTNYKADQEGKSLFQYSVRMHAAFDAVEAYRFGIERNQPLLVRRLTAKDLPAGLPFKISSGSVTVTAVAAEPGGKGFIVRLYNPSPERSVCQILPSGQRPVRVFGLSAIGQKQGKLATNFEMKAFEVRTILVQ